MQLTDFQRTVYDEAKSLCEISTAEEAQIKELDIYSNKGLTAVSIKRPRYTRYNKNGESMLHLYPNSGSGNTQANIDKVIISYVKKPEKPKKNRICWFFGFF